MKEQTIEIKINGEACEVLAGNAALLRFRKAGGDMSLISSIDGDDTDALFDSINAICNLISVNIKEQNMTPDDVANGVESMAVLFEAASTLLNQVPWLVGSN